MVCNIGFMVLDELARRWGVNTWKNDRNALCGEYRIPEKVLLLHLRPISQGAD